MFFWRRVAPQIPEEGLKPTATPGYTRNFRDLSASKPRSRSMPRSAQCCTSRLTLHAAVEVIGGAAQRRCGLFC